VHLQPNSSRAGLFRLLVVAGRGHRAHQLAALREWCGDLHVQRCRGADVPARNRGRHDRGQRPIPVPMAFYGVTREPFIVFSATCDQPPRTSVDVLPARRARERLPTSRSVSPYSWSSSERSSCSPRWSTSGVADSLLVIVGVITVAIVASLLRSPADTSSRVPGRGRRADEQSHQVVRSAAGDEVRDPWRLVRFPLKVAGAWALLIGLAGGRRGRWPRASWGSLLERLSRGPGAIPRSARIAAE
jgi:hypothetical protein